MVAFDIGYNEDHSPITQTFVNITSVYYVVDEGERENITVYDIDSRFDAPPTLTLNLSTKLPLAVGAHSIKVVLKRTAIMWLGTSIIFLKPFQVLDYMQNQKMLISE